MLLKLFKRKLERLSTPKNSMIIMIEMKLVIRQDLKK